MSQINLQIEENTLARQEVKIDSEVMAVLQNCGTPTQYSFLERSEI
jgi:hypothetical protein